MKTKPKKKHINVLKKKAKPKPKKAEKLDPRVEEIREEWVEYICPVRGKVRQKVKIIKYKSLGEQNEKHIVPTNTTSEQIDAIDNGLHIYSVDEEKAEKEE